MLCLEAAMNHHDTVCFPLFFISPYRFKTESGEFRTGGKVEIFTRLQTAYVGFKRGVNRFSDLKKRTDCGFVL